MIKQLSAIVFALAAMTACNKKKEPPAARETGSAQEMGSAHDMGSAAGSATGSAAGSAMTGSAAGSAAAAANVEVPTEMDFEDQAKTKITDKNLETQVQQLEKEVGQ